MQKKNENYEKNNTQILENPIQFAYYPLLSGLKDFVCFGAMTGKFWRKAPWKKFFGFQGVPDPPLAQRGRRPKNASLRPPRVPGVVDEVAERQRAR